MKGHVTVFCASNPTGEHRQRYLDLAARFGTLLAKEHFVCVNGGAYGMMRALSEAVKAAGGACHCVNLADHPPDHEAYTELRLHATLTDRQRDLLDTGDAYVALPGGTGTDYEVAQVLAEMAMNKIDPRKPVICVGASEWEFYRQHLARKLELGLINGGLPQTLHFVNTPDEALLLLLQYKGKRR